MDATLATGMLSLLSSILIKVSAASASLDDIACIVSFLGSTFDGRSLLDEDLLKSMVTSSDNMLSELIREDSLLP